MSELLIAFVCCLIFGVVMGLCTVWLLTSHGNRIVDGPASGRRGNKESAALTIQYDLAKQTARLVAQHPFVAVFALGVIPGLLYFALFAYSQTSYEKWTMTGELKMPADNSSASGIALVRIKTGSLQLAPDGKFTYEFLVKSGEKPNGGTVQFSTAGYCSVVVRASEQPDGLVKVQGTTMRAKQPYEMKLGSPTNCPFEQ